jgi:Zn finger protein HypA/HybF involved in hydrogenase expression
MHEWALAEAVVAAAAKTAARERMKQVLLLKVRVGELQRIDREIFETALQEILRLEKAPLREARTRLELEKAAFRCRPCGREWKLDSALRGKDPEMMEAIHFLPEMVFVHVRCPGCSSPDFEISTGRGVWLDTVEGER